MQMSPAKKEKLKANLGKPSFEDLHPKYPKGHPKGGQFMPKGGSDYVNAVAKNTRRSPAQVKASLGGASGVKTTQTTAKSKEQSKAQEKRGYKDFPPEVKKEIQDNALALAAAARTQEIAEQAKLNAGKGAKREAGKAFTAAKKEVSAKQKAVEAVLVKYGATKERAKQIAEKLIAQKVGQVKDGVKPVEKPSPKPLGKTVTKKAETKSVAPVEVKASKNVSVKELDEGLKTWDDFHKQNKKKDWYDSDSYEDQTTVADYIKEEGVTSRKKNTEHIGVVGKNGKLQSALTGSLSKEKGFYIDNLATAPWNLSPEDHPDKEKGSGAKAILEAIKKSKDAGFGGKISLEALPAAIPFYEHLGFTPVKKGRSDYVLTPEAADKLIQKYSEQNNSTRSLDSQKKDETPKPMSKIEKMKAAAMAAKQNRSK